MNEADLGKLFDLPKTVVDLDEKQQEAVTACCDVSRRLVAVTGKAGTGKTTIIKNVVQRLEAAGYTVGMSAPTGKAAKRITEVTGIPAMTNHRMLGYGMPLDHEVEDEKTGEKKVVKISTGPRYDRRQPMSYDVVIGDEYAMVNREIHDSILAALKPGGLVRYFGDVNQLKPIEENKLLQDKPSAFMDCLAKFNGIVLETNHRQAAGSGVYENAERILKGQLPLARDDFSIKYTEEPIKAIQDFVMTQLEQAKDYSTTDYQIITCMNKRWVGTAKLNLTVQSLFWNRDRDSMDLPRHKWINEQGSIRIQVGSKVVYTTNSYDLGDNQVAFNGEIGTVVEFDAHKGWVDVDFGDRVVRIPPYLIIVRENGTVMETDPRRNIDLAYVLTTHKMQGSECKGVAYVINRSTIYGQSRRNFYTAVTRAQQECHVITDMVSIQKSVKFAG